jgi:ribonucleoside-triphosphate reductase
MQNKKTICEVFSRSMGYIRPVRFFNIGKRQEFEERKLFKEQKALKKELEMPCGKKKGKKK